MIEYDDATLEKLFAELEPDKRLKALKGAFRKEANKVRKTAVNNFRGSIKTTGELEKKVRAVVFKKKAGFRVTIGPKKATKKQQAAEESFAAGRRRRLKEYGLVPIWTELGTKDRKTKTKTKVWKRERKGHSTGRIRQYGFMRKTRDEVTDSVTDNVHKAVIESVTSTAKKYGCI